MKEYNPDTVDNPDISWRKCDAAPQLSQILNYVFDKYIYKFIAVKYKTNVKSSVHSWHLKL